MIILTVVGIAALIVFVGVVAFACCAVSGTGRDLDTCIELYHYLERQGIVGDIDAERDYVKDYIESGMLGRNGWETYVMYRDYVRGEDPV